MTRENSNDSFLLERLRKNDQKAFQEIYDQYWRKLFSVAYNILGSKEESEELVQDIFENLWKKRNENQIEHLGVYLVVSAKHKSLNLIKSKINLSNFQEYLIYHEIQQNHSPDSILNFSDLSNAVDKALMNLPEKSCEIFRKSRFENMPVKKIASEYNLSEKAVEYHITKSLKALKEELKYYNSPN